MPVELRHLQYFRALADKMNFGRAAAAANISQSSMSEQIQRLEEILAGFGETHSVLKDAALSFTGNMAALAHVFAPDEILKNSFANFAFENFEAASYKSLLTLADAGGFQQPVSLLTASLNEELAMAAWVDEHNAELTEIFRAPRRGRDGEPLRRAGLNVRAVTARSAK